MRRLLNDAGEDVRSNVISIFAVLLAIQAVAWLWAVRAFHNFPPLIGTAFLAYSFGLRHAVDADHIAAIDNITRKLMQEGTRPVTAGFFFSLGHSTIVGLGSAAIAATAPLLRHWFEVFRGNGGVIGTLVGDRAYDAEYIRSALRARQILPALAMRNTKHGSGLGRWRWVVERTFAWLNQFRRLRLRYERRPDMHLAFLTLACILICWKFLQTQPWWSPG